MNNVRLSEMSKKRLSKKNKWELILHNDQTISFDHVMDCLVDICGHNEYQANQCAHITHHNNKCSIFVDEYEICMHVKNQLIKQGLTVTINKVK